MWSRRDPSSHVSRPSRQLDDVTYAIIREGFVLAFPLEEIGFIHHLAKGNERLPLFVFREIRLGWKNTDHYPNNSWSRCLRVARAIGVLLVTVWLG
jgi:hypothetical protein